jgi:enamine deaminase RidA (YjgF/YER057c/UK114 family)
MRPTALVTGASLLRVRRWGPARATPYIKQGVETMVYVKNLREHFDDIARLHREYFGDHRPTSTLLGVVDLALPPQLVEISAIAVLQSA